MNGHGRPDSLIATDRQGGMEVDEFQDRVVLVTGSSRGIGAAIAKLFATRGARVAVHGRDQSALEAVTADIDKAGGQALATACDLTRYGQIEAMRELIERRLGA